MIELRMLGEIRLRAEGKEIEALLRQPKRLALLAYLAAPNPGTWHRRDMLLALFWPELDTAHARTSLRNAVYVLRQSLGDDVVRSRGDEELSIDPEHLQTDVAQVWAALKGPNPHDGLSHYGGDLLPGLFPSDSEGFQRWLDAERMRLKVAVTTASLARLDELEQKGQLADALKIARRVIEIQPEDETIVRRTMSLHETMGDRAGGLAVFETYRERLASDFEAEPAPETVAVANRLRAASGASARSKPINEASSPSGRTGSGSRMASDAAQPPPPDEPRSNRNLIRIATITAATAAILTAVAWIIARPAHPPSIGSSMPLTSDEGLQIETAISPNGRLVAYAKGNAKRLRIFVQKVNGGDAWPLTDDSLSTQLMPRWSPDNDEVIFLSRNNAYVTASLGGVSRLVAKGTDGDGMIRSASWSPDGDSLLIVRNDSLTVRPLRGLGSRFVGRRSQVHTCTWSPGRKWIACMYGNWIAKTPGPLFGNDAPNGIVLYPSSGGDPVELTGHEYANESPAWSADGAFLWIVSNRDGAQGETYAIRVGDDGHASGPFVRVGVNAESIALSAGRFAYSVPVRKANLWAVPIPGDTTTSLAAAEQVTSGNQVIEVLLGSHDRKWLVYDSNLAGNADIYRIPVAGGPAERLTDDSRPEYAGALSPDGRELAWQRWVNGERHLFVKRLDGDSEQEIMPVPGDQGVPHWSPDGKSLAAWSHNKEQGALFVLHRDAIGKWMKPAWRLENGQLPCWSPDGRSLAFVRLDGSVLTIPKDSGAVTTVYKPRPGTDDPIATMTIWSLDPKLIWFVANDPKGRGGIWSVPASGGVPKLRVRLDDALGRSHGPGFATDGKKFYFTLEEQISNVRWAALVTR